MDSPAWMYPSFSELYSMVADGGWAWETPRSAARLRAPDGSVWKLHVQKPDIRLYRVKPGTEKISHEIQPSTRDGSRKAGRHSGHGDTRRAAETRRR